MSLGKNMVTYSGFLPGKELGGLQSMKFAKVSDTAWWINSNSNKCHWFLTCIICLLSVKTISQIQKVNTDSVLCICQLLNRRLWLSLNKLYFSWWFKSNAFFPLIARLLSNYITQSLVFTFITAHFKKWNQLLHIG